MVSSIWAPINKKPSSQLKLLYVIFFNFLKLTHILTINEKYITKPPPHHHVGAVALLKHLRAPDVVTVSVRDDDVFDVLRIESELAQAADDLLVGVVGVERVEDDDSLAGRERPGAVDLAPHEVEVVKDARRVGIPALVRRHRGRIRHEAGHVVARVLAPARGQQTDSVEQAEMLEARRVLRRTDCGLDLRIEVTSRSPSEPRPAERAGARGKALRSE